MGAATSPTSVPAASHASTAVFTTLDHGDGDDPASPNERLSGEAKVASLVAGTSCPALSFVLGSTTVSVTASTSFERGACQDIVIGAKLKVTGTRQPSGSVVATSVEVEPAEADDDDPVSGPGRNEAVEGEGVITGLQTGTSCPALTFLIGAKSIAVTAATVFDRGTCADLAIGARVHVKGTMTGDNIAATRVAVQQTQSPGHPVVEGDGRVTSLVAGTACPTLKFKADEWTITLDQSTTLVGGTCADIAVGTKLGVKGTITAEHEALASQIVFKGPSDN
jgi:hypothetical protein